MPSPIQATLFLADAATTDPTGKVHILGAGWSVTSSPTAPSAVVVLVAVPWDLTNQEIQTVLQLVDADGHPAQPGGVEPLESRQMIEVGRPPGVLKGTPIDANFQVTVGPLDLPPGRYTWQFLADGDTVASASFTVRS